MKIELGKSYKTRDGQKVRIICVDAYGPYPVVGLLADTHQERSLMFTLDGVYHRELRGSPYDLISEWREPIKVSGWVNIDSCGQPRGWVHASKSHADANSRPDRIACIYVSGTEGVESDDK